MTAPINSNSNIQGYGKVPGLAFVQDGRAYSCVIEVESIDYKFVVKIPKGKKAVLSKKDLWAEVKGIRHKMSYFIDDNFEGYMTAVDDALKSLAREQTEDFTIRVRDDEGKRFIVGDAQATLKPFRDY